MYWGWFKWDVRSPTWHPFRPFLGLWATSHTAAENTPVRGGGQKYQLLVIQDAGTSVCVQGAGGMPICGFYVPLLCRENPGERIAPCFCCPRPWMHPHINGMKSSAYQGEAVWFVFQRLWLFGCEVNWQPWITFMTCKWPFGLAINSTHQSSGFMHRCLAMQIFVFFFPEVLGY